VLLLNHYKDSLVYTVVLHATLQKADPEERGRIESAFERARLRAERHRESKLYLETLFSISQRLEKVQKLSSIGSKGIVKVLDDFSEKTEQPPGR
jgi:hypothetical protein